MKRENFDSDQEWYFSWWLNDLKEAGLVDLYFNQIEFNLSAGLKHMYNIPMKKIKDKFNFETIIPSHKYTTDFLVRWSFEGYEIFCKAVKPQEDTDKVMHNKSPKYILTYENQDDTHIEIKPIFDQNNMTRLAKINRQWVFDKHEIIVNIITPIKLFKKTFTPSRYFMTDGGKQKRKLNYKAKTLQEYLDSLA